MKAIGFTCGIGSMLVGARNAGFEIVGNIEWRRYYHYKDPEGRNTFTENFPNAFLKKDISEIPDCYRPDGSLDLAMGHPECGNYSIMSGTAQFKKSFSEMNKDPGDIPIFVELVKRFKPRFFVQDNLPRSLLGYSIQEWAEALPEYDLFPEWVSNWGYGNVQKYRNRFFMIGALKSERFVFIPYESEHKCTTRTILENPPETNHDRHTLIGKTSKGKGIYGPEHMTWAEYRRWFLQAKEGDTMPYVSADGSIKKHVGHRKGYKDGYVPVITGGCPIANPFTGMPFSLRERCRIQGLPDDFILYGTKYEEDGGWSHYKNTPLIKQTGKCMPVEFCTYVAKQIRDHIDGVQWSEGKRILRPNPLIDEAKSWYCEEVGYSNKERACKACWFKKCDIQMK